MGQSGCTELPPPLSPRVTPQPVSLAGSPQGAMASLPFPSKTLEQSTADGPVASVMALWHPGEAQASWVGWPIPRVPAFRVLRLLFCS